MQKSETLFERALEQKTIEARNAVKEFVRRYLRPDLNARQPGATLAFEAVVRLTEMVNKADSPDWLDELKNALVIARDHPKDSAGVEAVMLIASRLSGQLEHHQWKTKGANAETGFEFDAIYKKYRAECRIPELFDEIVRCLREIVTSGEVDSVQALRQLNTVIATIQRARDGSYFATRGAWYFTVNWLKNTGWELFASIPLAGSAVKGLRKTLEETNHEMQELHNKIHEDLRAKISADFPRLEYQAPQFPAIEHKPDSKE